MTVHELHSDDHPHELVVIPQPGERFLVALDQDETSAISAVLLQRHRLDAVNSPLLL